MTEKLLLIRYHIQISRRRQISCRYTSQIEIQIICFSNSEMCNFIHLYLLIVA